MAKSVIYDRGGALSTINGLLKDDYVIQQIQDQVNKATFFLSKLQTEMSTHGRKFIFPVQLGVSQGVGARDENKPLPGSGFGEYEQAVGNVKYLYSVFEITGQSIESTRGNRAAFADALKRALHDAREALRLDIQRQTWGQSSGIIGTVEGAVGGLTIVPVTNPYGLTYVGPLDNNQKTRLFKRNMRLYFATADAVRTVVAVNSDGTIEVDTAITLVDGELIYRGDSNVLGDRSEGQELQGITEIVNTTGTYLGIDRTGKPEWQSNVVVSSGTLTEAEMRIAMDTAEINGTAGPELILTDHVTRRRYEALLQSQKRFVNPMQLEGGFTAIEFDGLPMLVDKDAPPERMWFLRTSDIVWMSMADIQFMDRDGAVLDRVSGRDAYEAILFAYKNLACKRPVNQTVLEGITG